MIDLSLSTTHHCPVFHLVTYSVIIVVYKELPWLWDSIYR